MCRNKHWTFIKSVLTVVTLLSFALVGDAVAQKILIEEGFENHPLDGPDERFKKWAAGLCGCKITSEPAKTGKKSLAILGNGLVDGYTVSSIRTAEPITTIEFWVYIEKGGRSFSLKIASDDESFDNKGPEVSWDAGFVQFYANDQWQQISKFATDKWRYVRIVADFDRSVFDFYSGDTRHRALRAKPRKRIPFRMEATAKSFATEILVSMEAIAAPAYIDDLFVYEGENPIALAVDPNRKLATM